MRRGDYANRSEHLRASAVVVIAVAIFGLLLLVQEVRGDGRDRMTPEYQAQLMERAAELYYRWPKGRPVPIAPVTWAPGEWFGAERPLAERAVWGTIDAGRIVMHQQVLTHPVLGHEPVLSSLIVHEQTHILQLEILGPVKDCADLAMRELEAYRVQSVYLRAKGAPGIAPPPPPLCK